MVNNGIYNIRFVMIVSWSPNKLAEDNLSQISLLEIICTKFIKKILG